MPGHHGSAGGDGHAVKEITARDVALHTEFAVGLVAHLLSESEFESELSGAPNLGIGFLDGQFCTLESDAAVGSVAEWFVHRAAAAAQRKRGLAGEIVRGAIHVDQFYGAFGRFHAVRTIGADGDFNLSHRFIPPTLRDSSKDTRYHQDGSSVARRS